MFPCSRGLRSICFTLPGVPEPYRVFERSLDHLKALHGKHKLLNYGKALTHIFNPAGAFAHFFRSLSPKASQLIVSYDEHEVNNTFKFGVIYQKFGQVRVVLSSF